MAAQDGGTPKYIHGTSRDEQSRLSLMNSLINDNCMRELKLREGESVLDFGCGTGQFTRIMARAVGAKGRVVAIEREAEQINTARELAEAEGEGLLVDFRQGDATEPPLSDEERGSFDVVHTRFLLEHVPEPQAVVRQMVHAAKRGGRIILFDDDHEIMRVHPEPPGFDAAWKAYTRAYDRMGCDGYIGRRLVSLLHDCGAKPVRNTWVFYGACAGQREFGAIVENLVRVLRGARMTVIEHHLCAADVYDAGVNAMEAWMSRPDGAVWYAINMAEGAKL